MTTLEQLIEKLQSLVKSGIDPKIPVILEPSLDVADVEYGGFPAHNFFIEPGQYPLTYRLDQAQKFYNNDDSEDNFGYDMWEQEEIKEKQDVLVISSPSYKYGTKLKESL